MIWIIYLSDAWNTIIYCESNWLTGNPSNRRKSRRGTSSRLRRTARGISMHRKFDFSIHRFLRHDISDLLRRAWPRGTSSPRCRQHQVIPFIEFFLESSISRYIGTFDISKVRWSDISELSVYRKFDISTHSKRYTTLLLWLSLDSLVTRVTDERHEEEHQDWSGQHQVPLPVRQPEQRPSRLMTQKVHDQSHGQKAAATTTQQRGRRRQKARKRVLRLVCTRCGKFTTVRYDDERCMLLPELASPLHALALSWARTCTYLHATYTHLYATCTQHACKLAGTCTDKSNGVRVHYRSVWWG